MLNHVNGEEVIIAQVVNRAIERYQQNQEGGGERENLGGSGGRAKAVAPPPGSDAIKVQGTEKSGA
jgi:hypothetical protein